VLEGEASPFAGNGVNSKSASIHKAEGVASMKTFSITQPATAKKVAMTFGLLTLLSQFARRRSRVVLVEAVRTPRKPANECARDREPEGDDGVGEVSLRPRV
jgi:hypothetical protein